MSGMMNEDKARLLSEAVKAANLDSALIPLQDALGLTDGGPAAMFFSGFTGPEGEGDQDYWFECAAPYERRETLLKYWDYEFRNTVDSLAEAFSAEIRKALTPAQLRAVVLRNKDAGPLASYCHSHDFIDANECMIAAIQQVMGREIDPANQTDSDIINAAWDSAKADDFGADDVRDETAPKKSSDATEEEEADRLIMEAMKKAAPNERTHLVEVWEPNGQKWAVAIRAQVNASYDNLLVAGCKAARIDPSDVLAHGRIFTTGKISLSCKDARIIFIGVAQ